MVIGIVSFLCLLLFIQKGGMSYSNHSISFGWVTELACRVDIYNMLVFAMINPQKLGEKYVDKWQSTESLPRNRL